MGRDNQPKHRQQARDIARREAKKQPYKSILIVTEGETEAYYLEEIRVGCRLSTANVKALPSAYGTEPIQVVDYAYQLFTKGLSSKSIEPMSLDVVYVVFDRDDHQTYFDALRKIKSLDSAYENNDGETVRFYAVPSVPCFEVWILMHFADVSSPLHRDEAYDKLKQYFPDYDKAMSTLWRQTQDKYTDGVARAITRTSVASEYDGSEPITYMHELVQALLTLRD